jgi:hypothetical protein
MADNTQLLNMEDIKTKIQESVKVRFFELLPDEKFKELVNTEVNEFFNATIQKFNIVNNNCYYGNSRTVELNTPVSPFRAIIWNECNKLVQEKIQSIFASQGYNIMTSYLENGNETIDLSPALDALLSKKINELSAAFFKEMFSNLFSKCETEITNNLVTQLSNITPKY